MGVILSLLVLVLSIMPCSDEGAVGIMERARVEVAQPSHSPQQPFQDECSPFCHCACCATVAVVAPVAELNMHTITPGRVFNAYYLSRILEFPRAIWQPPQLS